MAIAAVLVAVTSLCSVVILWPEHGLSLNWDEVDYVAAADQGIFANLWERGSLSVVPYLRLARAKASGGTFTLPEGYKEPTDPFRLRHGHPPAVVAAMAPADQAGGERTQRVIQMLGAVALTVAVAIAYAVVVPGWSWAGLVTVLAILPWFNWHMFRNLQFHGWESVWFCLSLVAVQQWLRSDRSLRWGLLACASFVLCLVTLESGGLVLLGALACVIVWVRGLKRRAATQWIRRYALPGTALVALGTFCAWPGSVVKASLLKIPAERVYQAFIGEGDVYYLNRNLDDVVTYLLPIFVIAVTLGYLILRERRTASQWAPLAVMGLVYGALVMKFAVNETYYFPATLPFIVLLGWVVGALRGAARAAVMAVTVLLVAFGVVNVVRINSSDLDADRVRRADFAFVSGFLHGSPALLDGGHIFRRYVPDARIDDLSYNAKELLVRRSGQYVPVTADMLQGRVAGVLTTRTAFLKSAAARELTARCPRTNRTTVVLWDCRAGPG